MEDIVKQIQETHADITEQTVISSAKFVTEQAIPFLAQAGINVSDGSLISIHSISRILESDNAGRKFADILIWSGMFSEYDPERLICKYVAVEESEESIEEVEENSEHASENENKEDSTENVEDSHKEDSTEKVENPESTEENENKEDSTEQSEDSTEEVKSGRGRRR